MNRPIRVLIIEDSEPDAELLLLELKRGGYAPTSRRVDSLRTLDSALRQERWNLILSDYRLPQFNGLAALEMVKAHDLDLPFILVSGAVGEDTAVAVMKAGAHDFVLKDRLARLVPAVDRELREAEGRRQHRLAEAALAQREREYATLVRNLPDVIFRLDRQGQHLFIGGAVRQLTGRDPAALLGKTAREVGLDDGACAQFQQLSQEVFATGQPREFTFVLNHRHIAYRLVPEVAGDNSIGSLLGIAEDITERKHAEEALRQSEERYRLLVEAMPQLAWRSNAAGEIVEFNRRFLEYTGLSAPEATGRGWLRAIGPEDREEFERQQRAAVAAGRPSRSELRLRRHDGVLRWHLSLTLPVFDAAHRLTGWIGTATDIQEQKDWEAELQQRVDARTRELHREIETRKHLEGQLLEISEREQRRIGQDLHDGIGQRLTGITYLSSTLSRRLEADQHPESPKALRLTKLLEETIEQVRLLARGLHPVQADAEALPFALGELATAVKQMHNIDCTFQCAGDIHIEDNAVATHLYRIAQEAVNNAVRHAKPQSILITLQERNHQLSLSVRDDGIGLPPRIKPGATLGLTIMQYRAEMIGAGFRIRRLKPHGTQITCRVQSK